MQQYLNRPFMSVNFWNKNTVTTSAVSMNFGGKIDRGGVVRGPSGVNSAVSQISV